MARIILDAGHGGSDSGAVYQGRLEKEDNLSLTLAVGEILSRAGQDVVYTRTEDIYQTPVEKARIANELGGDFFISFHRNSSPVPNSYSGVEILLYNEGDEKEELAEEILDEIEEAGYRNLGTNVRTNLAVLRRTAMPAILIEAGFINTDVDNQTFDNNFQAIAQAIANGIFSYLDEENDGDDYRIQTGLFKNYQNAVNLQYRLINDGYLADISSFGEYYSVLVGNFDDFEEAAAARRSLLEKGYEALIIQI